MDSAGEVIMTGISAAEETEVEEALYAFNVARTGVDDGEKVAYALRDGGGRLLGLVAGWMWGGCLDIRLLWVHESLRGRGWGTRLLHAAEALASVRGCTQALLDTHSFQAPVFYQRQGYVIYATLDDYPVGHQKHYLKKRLVGSVDNNPQSAQNDSEAKPLLPPSVRLGPIAL